MLQVSNFLKLFRGFTVLVNDSFTLLAMSVRLYPPSNYPGVVFTTLPIGSVNCYGLLNGLGKLKKKKETRRNYIKVIMGGNLHDHGVLFLLFFKLEDVGSFIFIYLFFFFGRPRAYIVPRPG